jgi:hypothetical protein
MQHSDYNLLKLMIAGFGLFASVAMVSISLAHVQGRNYMPKVGIFFIFIPIWLCLSITSAFLESRTHSIAEIDPVINMVQIFAMIFLLNLPMVIAVIEGKNAVKSCFVYGFPVAILGILEGINTVQSVIITGFDYSENVFGMAFFFMGIYALLLNIELTKRCKTVDEQELIFDMDDSEGYDGYYGETAEEFAVSERDDSTDDYFYGYVYGYAYGPSKEELEGYVMEPDESYHDINYDELVVYDDILVTGPNYGEYAFIYQYDETLSAKQMKFVAEKEITAAGEYTLDGTTVWVMDINGKEIQGFNQSFTWTIKAADTAIDGVEAETENAVIYDLTGRRVEEITKGGIYIINGKKVIK